jgi:hypothetical protein
MTMTMLDLLWGVGDLDVLFGDAPKVVCPFPRAGQLKHPSPEHAMPDLTGSVYLTLVDPRDLWSSQGWVVRHHADYYRTGEWERTGVTSADRDTETNWYPLVVQDHLGRLVIKAGHHRATTALIEGRPLLARVFPDTKDQAVAVLPKLLYGWTSRLPHLKCRSAGEIVSAIREGYTALCNDANIVKVAAVAMSPSIPARRLPGSADGDHFVGPRTVAWASTGSPVDVTGRYSLCTTCGGPRAVPCPLNHTCEDHCRCEGLSAESESPQQREGRLTCQLCQICGLVVLKGHWRWRMVVCESCRPKGELLNRRVGRRVILPGIHSVVNGGPLLPLDRENSYERVAGFARDLQGMFAGVDSFHSWFRVMLLDRVRRLGFASGGVIPLEDYLEACRRAGIGPDDGLARLEAYLLGPASADHGTEVR